MFLREFSSGDLTSVYNLACSALTERYHPTLFLSISSTWPNGFLVVESPFGIEAFLLGIMTSPIEARILMLAVDKRMRRKGVGTMLMDRFIQCCQQKSAKTVTLEVRKGNISAMDLYYKFGFRAVGVIPSYYNDGEDAYKMDLFL